METNTTYFWLTFSPTGDAMDHIPLDHGDLTTRLNQILFTSLYSHPDDGEHQLRVELELGFAILQACNQIIRTDLVETTAFERQKALDLFSTSHLAAEEIRNAHAFTYPFHLGRDEKDIHLAFLMWILSKPQFASLQKHMLPPQLHERLQKSDFYSSAEMLVVQPLLKKTYQAYHEGDPLAVLAQSILSQYPLSEPLQRLIFRSLDRLAETSRFRAAIQPQFEYTFASEEAPPLPQNSQEHGSTTDSNAAPTTRAEGMPHTGPTMNTAPEWGQELVIIAKLLPVWLHQLSIKYGLQISTLDQIPEAELKELSELCITGLWLVGVWQRSPASRKIKKALGNPFALASAYSIFDYEIDPALGGTAAMKVLKDKASHHGIHLGADVIPNHTAIDSQWLKHHPDWFITTDTPPFPSYTFTSPNLSEEETLDVRLEDHYYDHRDAAVVFRYQNRQFGSNPLFVYHGNDGTHIPWNDTAQLNYLNPEVRKKMIDTIVAVSGDFPLIRLDAAMTLTRLHYKRLWFPPAGEGGAIPSRSGHMDSQQEFDARYGPLEFWQEVLIALNRANPQALLMAEAFWLMEPYFINQIGMHKVYHSAFMNLLRDHYGQRFNAYLHHLLDHYPLSTLNHFVNFLSTPDEAPAAVAFGKGDRYWAASILLTTFPGTPLYAHNQWDGIEEQYGMEFAAPMNNLPKDQGFYDYHRACLLPILRYRKLFSSAEGFRLCGFYGQGAEEDAHVIAFSNTTDKMTAFVIVNYQDKPISGKLLPAELEAPTSGSIEFLAESHQSEVTGTPFVGLTLKAWGYCVFLVRRE